MPFRRLSQFWLTPGPPSPGFFIVRFYHLGVKKAVLLEGGPRPLIHWFGLIDLKEIATSPRQPSLATRLRDSYNFICIIMNPELTLDIYLEQ
jgi:hypothetical protein